MAFQTGRIRCFFSGSIIRYMHLICPMEPQPGDRLPNRHNIIPIRLTQSAGDTIYIRMSTANLTHHEFRVYAPNGTLIAEVHDKMYTIDTLLHLDKTGEYTVFAGSADGLPNGTYTLFLQRINNPVMHLIFPMELQRADPLPNRHNTKLIPLTQQPVTQPISG